MSTTASPGRHTPLSNKSHGRGKKRRTGRKLTTPVGYRWKGVSPVDWVDWVQHLADRRKPASLIDLVPAGVGSPLRWNLPDDVVDAPSDSILFQLISVIEAKHPRIDSDLDQALELWLEGTPEHMPNQLFGMECLACCHALPRLASSLEPQNWWSLLDRLVSVTEDAAVLPVEEFPLTNQILTGELPLTVTYLFPEIQADGLQSAMAGAALSGGIVDLLDGAGLPNSRHLPLMRPLLACWTRSRVLAKQLRGRIFTKEAKLQYEWLVRQSLNFTRHDGSQSLVPGASGAWCPGLFSIALKYSDDDDDNRIAGGILPKWPGGTNALGDQEALPDPHIHSEWAETSMLRTDWSRKSHRLAVTYGEGVLSSELESNGSVLWSGNCNPQVILDGRPLEIESDWEEVCSFSDDDGDYLELEVDLSSDWILQRQLFLARQEGFLFIGDALLGSMSGQVEYGLSLPLVDQIAFEAAGETFDGWLIGRGKSRLAHCVPLALSEWRSDKRYGTLDGGPSEPKLSQTAKAMRLYAPLFVDLDPRRMKSDFTWRQLTVAEQLTVQSHETAVGYRIQIGKKQWLIYRSLAPRGNRTVLGQNTSSECVLASFHRDGTIDALVEIE